MSILFLVRSLPAFAGVAVTPKPDGRHRVEFRYQAPAGTRTVSVAGEFNEWRPDELLLAGPDAGGVWTTAVVLPAGRYEYKFVVDGTKWVADPDNPHRAGDFENSVAFVGIPVTPADPRPSASAPPSTGSPLFQALPEELHALGRRLDEASADKATRYANAWFGDHPMPWREGPRCTFVLQAPEDATPTLILLVRGREQRVPMEAVAAKARLFARTFILEHLPPDVAYRYELKKGEQVETILDPHAWSMTSRNGRPAGAVRRADGPAGRIELIPAVKPAAGGLLPRDVYVYLPPGYDTETELRYPVLYLHDGQNCWDDPVDPFGRGGWTINRIADRLVAEGRIEPFIAVGAANTADRIQEYKPGPNMAEETANAYLQFLLTELKPAIDSRYRTRIDAASTALMGASLGGSISLQAALTMPERLGAAVCMSPALMFPDDTGRTYLDLVRQVGKVNVRLYVDHGTGGKAQDGAPYSREVVAALRAAGWRDGPEFEYFEDVGATHDENAWRKRTPRALTFLYGRSSP